ncbi:hypothetical protein A2363_01125 [Candidatus Gottesmanbacteria bacterium RIFOXYB1_FULL_47_11]|uniref:Uncharacterized protein n=1 Tax=Candidatus Gottesmanbacteria bacterium RIFOXYB1_FULL_47_11 TaxID=1798401 RepID=A0A1F6BE60_9BACT|nr:MAG: hypothetical protein A2363_01125 [Candidatus Gottesmanbacteria bacterium RIFOXYB1_FULL_47_11]
MTSRDASLAKAFVVFVCVVAVGVAATVYMKSRTPVEVQAESVQETIVPVGSSTRFVPVVQTSEAHSSKADKQLVLRATTRPEGETEYAFYITDMSGGSEWTLFSRTLSSGASMALPFNTWDPTDTYVFLEETTGGIPNYYVLHANGQPFANGELFIDVGAVWNVKKPGYKIRQATGWASGTLLILYTTKEDGSKGPAFWFEIPSTAILQLAG